MSIEIEFKYVIKNVRSFEEHVLQVIKNIPHTVKHIQQHYLNSGGRVRSVEVDSKKSFEFNYKDFLGEGKGNIEFDMPITEEEYIQCLDVSCLNLTKTRIVIPNDKHNFEIDIFKKDNVPYFILMEVEVKTLCDTISLEILPDIVKDNIIVKTLDDSRFSSKSLANKDYAKELYEKLKP